MDKGPLGVTPPDDTGSDTFRRYRYQAEIAFAFCLDTALIGNVRSVIPEHIEDIALEFADGTWRFLQIKSRDSDQGPWTLSLLLGTDGGSYKSLFRAYRALQTVASEFRLELRLEGGIKKGDPAYELVSGGILSTATVELVAHKLSIPAAEAEAFLQCLTLRPDQPSRDVIQAVNERKLGLAAPSAPGEVVREVYAQSLQRIEAAMDARLDADRWPTAAMDVANQTVADREVLKEKRLTKEILEPIFRPLGTMEPTLLHRLTDPDTSTSTLEDKLWAWGANQAVVDDAKLLRAHASIREAELAASSLFGDAGRLDDVRVRLRVVANASAAEVGGHMSADRVWALLQVRTNDQRDALDQFGLFKRDPMLLLGEICELSDLCEYDWGRPRA